MLPSGNGFSRNGEREKERLGGVRDADFCSDLDPGDLSRDRAGVEAENIKGHSANSVSGEHSESQRGEAGTN